ncbi:MAG: 30S ribosomal protein S12 methylthiotransferase RimO [gamma proteobacterium symbiont of Bathyaustriella thionipta]|nr:30S ribosomal protein S12 methylthiotransferase RimO [gamma proteobacterium symbiont of Bathyaustriella thionipta]MCU7950732.1 30S ribosomal protein S12 methylthiotransferase RimO [gamma proteobacterium symbiont of Bathyaustriella thionipta]MCU7954263.1 30S ribosomal protein S12 methylthiotransferase RimO [gamma proteobacterium symbiont of Bathyaustriella thionipta]MCU7957224.1 30S ribosomal protein S12 methylthiotransferase RimO [gamma proteobacterium symbiont of Bathyaustriella thionipta]M
MAAHKIGFISLGCPKALVDSEQILTRLRAEGYDIGDSYQNADMVVVNTCGFIDEAVEESLDAIGEALTENGKVIVTGCLGGKGDIVKQAHPQVLAVTGPHALEEVMAAVHAHIPPEHDPYTSLIPEGGIKLTPRHYAYLKISEGCNHSCSFCIIPSLRGDLVSRPVGEVLQEAENLVHAGVRELLVVSQDTSAYGVDVKYQTGFYQGKPVKTRFKELSSALGELDTWVRMHYVYPYPHVDDVIPLMAEGKILPYLDIPLQHSSPKILKAMKRPANTENMLKRIASWREICPDITLRSTFIVGFPGETEEDFEDLLTFIKTIHFDRVGAFKYSPVEGASANELADPVPEKIKQARLVRLMELQSEISFNKLQAKIGQSMRVIIDSIDEKGLIARSAADAPEVDGLVFVDPIEDTEVDQAAGLNPGDFINVKIIDNSEHDLWAELL